ncbi:MAG: hypothetical protein HC859_15860, partial [Bacteroidia bacterium]|nr:hypothetical protein [Bacteroidia bacterium]
MNKQFIRYIGIALIMVSASCGEDFITKSDPDQATYDLVLGNIDQVNSALTGVYDGLQTANYYGRYYVLVPDLMADGVRQNPDNSNRGTAQYRYEVTTNSGIAQG